MASAYKILGQVSPILNTDTDIISTVPSGKSYIVSSITVSAYGKNTEYLALMNLYAIKGGGSLDTSSAILYNVPIEFGTDISFTIGITLGVGDRLAVRTNNSSIATITAFGEEITA